MTVRACTLATLIAASFATATAVAEDRNATIIDTPTTASLPVAPEALGQAGGNLVYTPVTPCRLLDTRVPSARSGPLGPDAQRDFLVFDADLSAEQGGNPDGCNLPAQVEALAVNLVAVDPAGPGFMVAWPAGQTRPLAASLNLIPGQDLANQVSIGVNNDPASSDMSIYSWAQVHVVADVVGYYARSEATALQCITRRFGDGVTLVPGARLGERSPLCEAGWTAVSGWCSTFMSEDVYIIDERLDIAGQLCIARNNGAESERFQPVINCCRLPGR